MKKLAVICAAILVLSAISGCEKDGETVLNNSETISETNIKIGGEVTFTDSAGRTVTVSDPKKTAVFTSSFADIWQLAGGTISFATEDVFNDERYELPDGTVNIVILVSPSA
ncbi:MAG: hypothetical protein K2K44_02890 [Oscillospiraceae bacterium]|nr:hypothetical protein [Oscillospiraceae bacterium]